VGSGGDEHLAAVPDRGDPRRAVDVDPDVALLGDERLPRVDAHANADRPLDECGLRLTGRYERVSRPREGDEEGVALSVDLDAAAPLERLAQRPSVIGERIRVGVAQLVEQLRRALDVGEEEGDGARRELTHPPIIAP